MMAPPATVPQLWLPRRTQAVFSLSNNSLNQDLQFWLLATKVYAQAPPLEPYLSYFPFRATPAAQEGNSVTANGTPKLREFRSRPPNCGVALAPVVSSHGRRCSAGAAPNGLIPSVADRHIRPRQSYPIDRSWHTSKAGTPQGSVPPPRSLRSFANSSKL